MIKSSLTLLALLAGVATAQAQATSTTDRAAGPAAATTTAGGAIAKGEGPAVVPKTGKAETARADVRADAASAVRNPNRMDKGGSPPVGKPEHSDKSRAEVRQEAASATRSGNIGKGPDVRR